MAGRSRGRRTSAVTASLESRFREAGPPPYLSVVATARNDDHGGDLLYRMQVFVNALVAQCERHRVRAELILVEWNPPDERPSLAESLDWPSSDTCEIRIVRVPNAIHSRLAHSERLPLFQMIAKNVGIRRARGDYVLATNVDVLLSDELMTFLASDHLHRGHVYRVDRYDVRAEFPADVPVEDQLRGCEEHVIRVCRRQGTLDLQTGVFYRIYPRFYAWPWLVAFLAHTALWLRQRARALLALIRTAIGHVVNFLKRTFPAWLLDRFAALADGIPTLVPRARKLLHGGVRLHHVHHQRERAPDDSVREPWLQRLAQSARGVAARLRARGAHYRTRYRSLRESWQWERARVPLHTNASGDFTLMSRHDWAHLRGYAELQMFSMHIDGLLLYQAHYARIRERLLPYRVYHLEHSSGFKPDEQGLRALNERLNREAIPQITNEQFMEWAMQMYRERRAIVFNGEDWGFSDEELEELRPLGAVTADLEVSS
jgi:hypothetical protein